MTPSPLKRGIIIVFEGCDRSGKTTQCRLLNEWLNKSGNPAELFRFPERNTQIGRVINDYLEKRSELEDHAVHLLFSANRWELLPKMMEKLEKGVNLIIDRYAYSGVAFTAAKKGFTLDWCKRPDAGLPLPDLVLYLTLSAEESSKRGGYGNERYEKTDFQERVAENFDILSRDENWKTVDASCDIATLHERLKSIVTEMIGCERKEPKRLWIDD